MVEWDRGFTSSSPEYQQLVLEDDDIEQFRSEKILKNDKSPEEIKKLSVDESLSEMDRAALLISTGQDIQKLCVVEQLPRLLKIDQMDSLCRVVPKVCSLLPGANEELQESASRVFAEIIQQELVPVHIYVTACLPSVLKQLECRDAATSSLWLDTVLAIVPHLPKEVIKRQILRIAEANGQLSMSVASRLGTCKLLGAMAGRFDSYWVKKELLPLAKSLCLDVDSGVRVVMCQQLNQIIRALGMDIAKPTLFSHLLELTNDEEQCVKSSAIEALLDLVSFLDKSTLTNEVVSTMKRHCEWAMSSGEQDAILSVARMLGRICHELKDYLSTDQRFWFMEFYRKLVNYSCPEKRLTSAAHTHTPSTFTLTLTDTEEEEVETECRRWCAYNLPAMVLFCDRGSFEKELLRPLKRLAQSPHISVRRTLASGLHELVKTVRNGDRLKLAPIYQTLLKDTSGDVLYALVGHLQESLDAFAQSSNLSPETRQPGLLDFIPPLLSCEQLASELRQWRLHHQLLSAMECLINCMTSDHLYTKFVPILFKYITGKCVLPVKLAACKTLCVFIRYIRKQELRLELCIRLCEECAQNSSYKQRLLYIDICGFILDIFSRSFFKEQFFQPLLELANDPIVNVRLHLCRLLPSLKSILKLPGDRVLLQKLEQTVRKLISHERDPDASQAIRDAVTEMDRIEVAMETLTRRTFFEADLTDQRREDEEKALLLSEAKDSEKQAKKATRTSKSPSESRKSSSSSLVGLIGGTSPTAGAKCAGKQGRGSLPLPGSPRPTVTKSLSAPSPPVPSNEQSNHTNLLVSRKGPTTASSPQTSPSVARKTGKATAGPGSKGSQTSMIATTSKVAVNKSKDSVSSGAKSTQQKKKGQQYGLEYSKSRKRT